MLHEVRNMATEVSLLFKVSMDLEDICWIESWSFIHFKELLVLECGPRSILEGNACVLRVTARYHVRGPCQSVHHCKLPLAVLFPIQPHQQWVIVSHSFSLPTRICSCSFLSSSVSALMIASIFWTSSLRDLTMVSTIWNPSWYHFCALPRVETGGINALQYAERKKEKEDQHRACGEEQRRKSLQRVDMFNKCVCLLSDKSTNRLTSGENIRLQFSSTLRQLRAIRTRNTHIRRRERQGAMLTSKFVYVWSRSHLAICSDNRQVQLESDEHEEFHRSTASLRAPRRFDDCPEFPCLIPRIDRTDLFENWNMLRNLHSLVSPIVKLSPDRIDDVFCRDVQNKIWINYESKQSNSRREWLFSFDATTERYFLYTFCFEFSDGLAVVLNLWKTWCKALV